jgi:hypothetical protein
VPDLQVSAIVVAVGEGNRRTVASNRTRHTPSAQLGSWTHGEAIIGLMNQLFERLSISSAVNCLTARRYNTRLYSSVKLILTLF